MLAAGAALVPMPIREAPLAPAPDPTRFPPPPRVERGLYIRTLFPCP